MSDPTTFKQTGKKSKKQAKTDKSKKKETRPDPFFKRITLQIAHRLGLEIINAEFPQTLRADNILGVPEGVDLSRTAYHFFLAYNVIEFKGPDDSLTEYKYITNDIRTNFLILDDKVKEADFHNTLNLIVCARYPERFFAFMQSQGFEFTPDSNHSWLYRRKVGLQNVAIVVLKDMPLNPMYYEWLRLAPTDSTIWKELVKVAFREQDVQLLQDLWELDHEVVEMTAQELKEIISEMSPERRKKYLRSKAAGVRLSLADLKTHPEEMKEALSELEPEQVISLFAPEQVIQALAPEQVVEALAPDEEEKMLELLLKKRREREQKSQENQNQD